jgi:hypothetical protein
MSMAQRQVLNDPARYVGAAPKKARAIAAAWKAKLEL